MGNSWMNFCSALLSAKPQASKTKRWGNGRKLSLSITQVSQRASFKDAQTLTLFLVEAQQYILFLLEERLRQSKTKIVVVTSMLYKKVEDSGKSNDNRKRALC